MLSHANARVQTPCELSALRSLRASHILLDLGTTRRLLLHIKGNHDFMALAVIAFVLTTNDHE